MEGDTASFSPDGRLRYELVRWTGLGNSRTVNFVLLNPSTAGAQNDDPTVRCAICCAQRWGFGRLVITNVCPLRSPRPTFDCLAELTPIELQQNDVYVQRAAEDSEMVVVAYGARGCQPGWRQLVERAHGQLRGRPLYCLGFNNNGCPRHLLRNPCECPEPLSFVYEGLAQRRPR